MAARFNPPPGWPSSPEGWTPPPGWQPDPSWPAPPTGWQLWIEEGTPSAPASAPTSGTLPTSGVPTTGRKPWLIPVIAAVAAILLIVGVLFSTGVLGGSDDPKNAKTTAEKRTSKPTEEATDKQTEKATDKPTDKPTEEATDTPTDKPTGDKSGSSVFGTHDAPLVVGSVANLGIWDVTLAASDFNAWDTVSPEFDEFDKKYYAPAEGESWVMAPAKVTYTGAESGQVHHLDWSYISKSGNAYSDECSYSHLPGGIDNSAGLLTGDSAAGNVCVVVPTTDIDGGVWRIDTFNASYDEVQAFFATK